VSTVVVAGDLADGAQGFDDSGEHLRRE
jgi:hypothetical protein